MDDSTGTPCPECGAPRNRDNTPSCACTLRASDALREARTAQAAEAEDFTPLRIRPYVELDDGTTAAPGTPNSGGTPGGGRTPEPEAGRGAGQIEQAGQAGQVGQTGQAGQAGQVGQAGQTGRPEQKAEESPAPSGTDQQDAPAAHGGLTAGNEQTPQSKEQGGETTPGAPQPADATMQLRALTPDALAAPETPDTPVASGAPGAPGDPDATSVLPSATPVTAPQPSPLAAPLAPPTTEPSATDLNLFDSTRPLGVVSTAAGAHAGPGPGSAPDAGEPSPPGGRRRRTTLLVAAGAVVAVIGAAGWASGLFAHETPSRDGALPKDVRASVLNAPSDAPSAAPATSVSGSPEASAPASASAPPSGSASPSASPSASESEAETEPGASAAPSDAAEPSAAPTATAPADVPEEAEEVDEGTTAGPALRRGDRGPEVVDLQQRLSNLYLYNGPANGRFSRRTEDAVRNYQWSRGIRGDELGVYGPETRARLEAETGNR
ncbi:peptidoglycan-binding domain-containing protein [Streptomyces hirsutus]|uniref:peptidoglycan-binding domain-containing protein n=1 Tax=Streptomyces hirsutus TaxID=35620 RepID=UPI00364960E2